MQTIYIFLFVLSVFLIAFCISWLFSSKTDIQLQLLNMTAGTSKCLEPAVWLVK